MIGEFPQLQSWYQNQSEKDLGSITEKTAWKLSQTLSEESKKHVDEFIDLFDEFLTESSDPDNEFSKLLHFLSMKQVNFNHVLSAFAEESALSKNWQPFFGLMQKAAEAIEEPSFRFLAAWLAFNANQFKLCLEECNKIKTDFPEVRALQGQALLEGGHADKALAFLEEAVESKPENTSFWFQLAKAEYALSKYDKAWESLSVILKKHPENAEAALLSSFTALQLSEETVWSVAWETLFKHLPKNKEHHELVDNLVKLSFLLNDKDKAKQVVALANWKQMIREPSFLKALSHTLKVLGEKEWKDLAHVILSEIEPSDQPDAAAKEQSST